MKNRTLVHACFVPDLNSASGVFGVSQKFQAQRTVTSITSACTSLPIGVNKEIVNPVVHARNLITPA
jgi:hypothetical protein